MNPPTSTALGTLYGLLLTLAGVGLTALLGWGAVFLAAKAKESKAAALVLELYELAQSVVAHVGAEIRPQLTSALADGKLSPDEAKALKERALALLKGSLGDEGMKRLASLRGLVGPAAEVYLSGLIERALGLQKAIAAGTVPPP